MTGWDSKPLGDLCEVLDSRRRPVTKKDRRVGEYPYYGATGVVDYVDDFIFDEPLVLVGEDGAKWASGEGTAFLASGRYWVNNHAHVVRPIRTRLLDDWLVYYLVHEDLSSFVSGLTVPKLNQGSLREIPIPLPLVAEQRRIVAILDEAFAGISTAKANAEKNLRNARELFDGYLHTVFTDCGSDWLSATIEQHIRFIDYRGKTPDKKSDGLRLITAKNVKKGFIQREPMEFVAPESYDGWMTRGIPKIGDVLFTTEAPLGNVAQLDTEERVAFAQRVIIMQADPKVLDNTFFKYMLLSAPVQARIHSKATGATALGIKASLLKRIQIAFPRELAEQRSAVRRLDALADASSRLETVYANKLVAIEELKQSLLSQAFSGNL